MKFKYLAFTSPTAAGVKEKINLQTKCAETLFESVEVFFDKSENLFLRLVYRYIELIKILTNKDQATVYYVRQQALLPFLSVFLHKKKFAYEVNAHLPSEILTYGKLKRWLVTILNDDRN